MQKNTNEYYKYIRSHISIADVCKALDMQLRPVGNAYITQCFLHSDEHPSLRIFTEENRYHCFQCGENGDIFQLVKGKLGCNFSQALSWLEERFPQILSEKPDFSVIQADGGRGRYADGLELAWDCYRKMTEDEEDKLRLFAEKRGYTADFLKKSQVVFASKQKLKNQYGGDERFIEEQNLLQEAGLLQKVSRTENTPGIRIRYEDYFRTDRVIIALRDRKGKLVGFAGRSVSDSARPKYLFTRNLNKKDWLYGFDAVFENVYSRNSRKKEVLYLVEGIFDVLRLRSKNINAVAVMGSYLLQGQVKILADYVSQSRNVVDLRVLMDSDEAGFRGNFQTVKSLWNSEVLRKTPVKVAVLKEGKDPDECLKGQTASTKSFAAYSAMEYVFRYLLCSGGEQPVHGAQLIELDPEKKYNQRSTDEKLLLLRQIEELMTKSEWQQMLGWQSGLSDAENTQNRPEHFIWNLIRQYLSDSSDGEEYGRSQEKDYLYHMHTALQIARTSYDRESLLLDEDSWDRIAAGADAFFPYFYELLEEGRSIDAIPMIEIYTPKKRDVQRRKTFYIHEELLLQQYVLNELLSSGVHRMYEELIPAVRFSDGTGSYVTGYGAPGEVVSFAYQINMAAVNGTKESRQGMFRSFYDCWKDYIRYVRDGIEKLDGKRVYKVKLDIKGFYDNIPKSALRDALYRPIQQALLKDDQKFRCFHHGDGETDTRAHILVQWVLNELYKDVCYSAQTGQSYKRGSASCGIPQGPNLSAYAANVLLFDLDRQIYDIVQEVNRKCEEGKIAVRYCRYVDDMIIIASDPLVLLRIKDTISGILYDLGLELSNKTDEEESVSKDEAFDWTVSARGGLGVSAGFDMADDSLESVIDDCDGYDVVDRREALRLLSGALRPGLYETEENRAFQETVSEAQLLNIIFQTEEIRINDIIRFAELLICRITESQEELFGAYRRLWNEGKKSCPQDSVLQTAGIEVYVFLESCIKILMRKKRADREALYQGWAAAAKKIEETIHPEGEFAKQILRTVPEEELLKKNYWVLCLKYLELCSLLQMDEDIFADTEKLLKDNSYGERWLWTVSGKKIPEISESAGSLQCFQFVLAQYQKADSREYIQEINSQIRNYKEHLKTFRSQQDLLIRCIEIWTDTNLNGRYSEQDLRMALCVLLNILPDQQKAETIKSIEPLADYLFPGEEGMQVLPVFPGVDYPGMMAYEKQGDFLTAERYDFQTDDAKTGEDSAWEMQKAEKVSGKAKHYIRKWSDRDGGYVSLEEYFRQDTDRLEAEKEMCPVLTNLMRKVLEVYRVLEKEIREISDAHREEKLLLSKKNVILCKEPEGNTIHSVNLGLSYLISSRKTGDTVALEKNGNYVLEKVNESGASFWIAGRLLADAIHLTQIHLQTDDKNSETAKCAEMLRYVFRRLEGHYLHLSECGKKSPHSWEKTVDRALGHLKNFLDREAHRDVYLENAGEEDNFIRFRLGRDIYDFEDVSLDVAIWAKNCLRGHYPELVRLMGELPAFRQKPFALKRRVPKWYCFLAAHLYQLASPEASDFPAIRTLSAGFFADGVLMNLRMQTLERIHALDQRRRDAFFARTEIPYAELGLAENSVLLTGEQKDSKWGRLWKNLLNRKTDRNIRHLTHLGWIVLLAKLYELDKTTGYICTENQDLREKVQMCLGKLVEMLTDRQEDLYLQFPYEGLGSFYALWTPENVHQMIEEMNLLDEASGIIVEKGRFADYSQKVRKDEVTIGYGNYMFTETSGFLTYSKLDGRLSALEKDADDSNKTVFTQTRKGEAVLGISTIAELFGRLLQAWEKKAEEQADTSLDDQTDEPGKALQENGITEENAGEEEEDSPETAKKDGSAVSGSAFGDTLEEVKGISFGTGFAALRKEQKSLWKSRRKELEFSNFDRIALFQFSIDSSYYPPSTEKCRLKSIKSCGIGGEDKNMEQKSFQVPECCPSCAEYRRREILKPVLETCSIFGVEILLLPEYSIRPETADWIADTIYNNKNYNFSVWAGTFRIPAKHQFPSGRYWDDEKKLNSKEYRHAAVLPVIFNDSKVEDRQVKIVTHRVKKYPSVALHEEINPYPGVGNNNFKPLMKKYYESRYEDNHLLGDARDHVTELICAEVFAVCAICNYPSLLKESYAAFQKYTPGKEEKTDSNTVDSGNRKENNSEKNKSKEERKIPRRFEEYEQEMLEDIREYGKYTAIYQMQKHFLRTPIVLVPACTTRAADYYVWGQGQYLAAGLKMVLCNSTGLETRGGSCFIGQESWDDRNITYDERKLCNTLYHGLKPGIFRQSSPDKDRGALGSKEQALLICDVNPNYEKSQPNAESMLDSLSLVAHIPVFEEQIHRDEKCAGCRNPYLHKGNTGKNSVKGTEKRLKKLIAYVNAEETSLWKNTMDADDEYTVKKEVKDEVKGDSETDDQTINKSYIAEILRWLGKKYESRWLERRADFYEKYSTIRPQKWPAPTILDWLYIKVDYEKFMEAERNSEDECVIQMTE
ncbi:hypothetical protein B5E77_03325 [Lachnoclostridium sp. An131]|uniref:CHC2 zinc finger domain-containing protein n=1 Tax=Lachnoclostridium sp. An131 TaxID=1965555 RepID=UPI000B399252|nr:CHC2 zinc finger domain-containing protein [Lachnoclostridium sp. An131]OUQ28335.1 hypothetical protein B5E77_03325 [Lachnoclostridium sp. An131]